MDTGTPGVVAAVSLTACTGGGTASMRIVCGALLLSPLLTCSWLT